MEIYPLKANKNILVAGDQIKILRGFSIADPYRIKNEDNVNVSKIIKDIAKSGANVVRVPIQPDLFGTIPDFLETYVDEIIAECKNQGLYCVIDWHAIGNPLKNETRMKEKFKEREGIKYYTYDSTLERCKEFWQEASKRYGKETNVIFEIFNEPAPGEKDNPKMGLSALNWTGWKKEAENILNIIRKNSTNLVLISPIKWAYNLSRVAEEPLEGENIAYSVHPYPIHKDWKDNFDKVINKFPLIVTEWGFMEETSQEFMKSTPSEYGEPMWNYMEKNNISWIAWCYDPIWNPKILNSWKDADYSKWGKFVVSKLLK